MVTKGYVSLSLTFGGGCCLCLENLQKGIRRAAID